VQRDKGILNKSKSSNHHQGRYHPGNKSSTINHHEGRYHPSNKSSTINHHGAIIQATRAQPSTIIKGSSRQQPSLSKT
jgi:hypothetical protein